MVQATGRRGDDSRRARSGLDAAKRGEIARRVIASANRRLGLPEQSSSFGKLPIDPASERLFLEKLQTMWGAGWMLAIPSIKYEWPV